MMSLLAFSLFLPENLAGFNDFMTRLLASKLTGHEDSRSFWHKGINTGPRYAGYYPLRTSTAFLINSRPTKHHDLAHNPSSGKPPKYDKKNRRMADQGQALQNSAVYFYQSHKPGQRRRNLVMDIKFLPESLAEPSKAETANTVAHGSSVNDRTSRPAQFLAH
ncbi:hypothetical protein B0H17DRAFT_1139823 [Mycena rosella]|uniref:Uncharacterized protein n=1 Tax=Mycena rosella TaxID=1033263 RepID=A0AAD7D3S6_MYCRO|nr:hypothetical protein B0H17DRAFT_1139823 [Mycena rosella]